MGSSVAVPAPYREFIVSGEELSQGPESAGRVAHTLVEEPELFEEVASATLIGIRQAARRLGVHENTIRHWAERGLIQFTRLPVSGYRRVSAADVERLRGKMANLLNSELRLASDDFRGSDQGHYQGGGHQIPRDEGW
jgi:excisionase family DNA binding protein